MIKKIDRATGRNVVIIFAGELYVSMSNELVMTTVGGCVSICILGRNCGGMNHYLLPQPNKDVGDKQKKMSILYGVNAITALITALEREGCTRKEMRATIVGGSDSFTKRESPNVLLARLMLEAEDVRIDAVDVGGNSTRRIILDPLSGIVTVHKRKGIIHDGKDTGPYR